MKRLAVAILAFMSAMVGMGSINAQEPEDSAEARKMLNVDARTHCLSAFNGEFGAATLYLANGSYVVSLASRAYYSGERLPVKKVAFYITTDDQPTGWFHIAIEGKPIYVRVSGLGVDANTVRAFFIDGGCGDNTGDATLTFRRARIPVMCAGTDC